MAPSGLPVARAVSTACPPGGNHLVRDVQMSDPDGNGLSDILADRTGHVWVSATKYIREFNPGTHAFRTYRASDASIGVPFFYRLEPLDDLHVGVDGAGAYFVLAASESLDRTPDAGQPPVVRAVRVGDSLRLMGRGQERITVPASASDLMLCVSTSQVLHPELVSFAYCEEGLDNDWVFLPQGSNTIPLHNLSPGRHTFRLMATDSDGCWMEAKAASPSAASGSGGRPGGP